MKVISKRALNFLENPQYYKSDLSVAFQVELDQSDRILTVLHHGSQRSNEEKVRFLFNEALASFAKNKKILDLWKISFREVESFLRDENHLPAFESDYQILEEMLDEGKISLVKDGLGQQLKSVLPGLQSRLRQWSELSLAAKNQWAMDLLEPLEWELVFAEDTQLSITNVTQNLQQKHLQALLSALLLAEGESLPMKVVAVQ